MWASKGMCKGRGTSTKEYVMIRFLYIAIGFLWFFFGLPTYGQDPSEYLAVISDKNYNRICLGVWLKENFVVTSRHCFLVLDASRYRVRDKKKRVYQIEGFAIYEEQSLFYPNFDIIGINLKKNIDGIKIFPKIYGPGKPRNLLAEFVGILNGDLKDKGSDFITKKVGIKLTDGLNGFRLKNLLLGVKTNHARVGPGDSGGPIFIEKKGQRYLVGILNGILPAITGKNEGYHTKRLIFTNLSAYRNFIRFNKKRTVPLHRKVFTDGQSILSLCKTGITDLDGWHMTQWLLNDIITTLNLSQDRAKKIFERCHRIDEYYLDYLSQNPLIRFDQGFNLTELAILKDFKRFHFSDVDATDIKTMANYKNIEELTLYGLKRGIDLNELGTHKELKILRIMHARDLGGLMLFIERHPNIEELVLFNIKTKGPITLAKLPIGQFKKIQKVSIKYLNGLKY